MLAFDALMFDRRSARSDVAKPPPKPDSFAAPFAHFAFFASTSFLAGQRPRDKREIAPRSILISSELSSARWKMRRRRATASSRFLLA